MFMRGAALSSRSNAGRVQIAQFPGQQQAAKEHNREGDPNAQCHGHFFAPGVPGAIVFQQKKKGAAQAADDAYKCKNDPIFHEPDYLVKAGWKFWLITVSALLALAATLALGRWQVSRASQKEAWQASIAANASLPALEGQALALLADPASALHRRVTLRGHWLARHTVFLENRQMGSKVGLYVVTPLQLGSGGAVVWVQRGWVARNFVERGTLPVIETPIGEVEIEGRIAPPPAKLYELGKPAAGRLRQNLDGERFRADTGLTPLPVSVQQSGAASEGLLRDWPLAGSGVAKHYGYAFQWFALSALIAILYVWFQIVRRFIYPRRR